MNQNEQAVYEIKTADVALICNVLQEIINTAPFSVPTKLVALHVLAKIATLAITSKSVDPAGDEKRVLELAERIVGEFVNAGILGVGSKHAASA